MKYSVLLKYPPSFPPVALTYYAFVKAPTILEAVKVARREANNHQNPKERTRLIKWKVLGVWKGHVAMWQDCWLEPK